MGKLVGKLRKGEEVSKAKATSEFKAGQEAVDTSKVETAYKNSDQAEVADNLRQTKTVAKEYTDCKTKTSKLRETEKDAGSSSNSSS